MSLAGRLSVLIALALIPVLTAQVYTQFELRQQREATARADAMRYTRLVSSDAARVLESARSILLAVGEVPFIRERDIALCSAYLGTLAKRYPQIVNITLIDDAGKPVCANTPIAPSATAADRYYFEEAKRSNDFVVGDYIVGRTIPEPQLPVAEPFHDDADHRFVLSIGIGFDWLQQHFGGLALPPGATLWIADHNGTVVIAPAAPNLLGKKLPAAVRPPGGGEGSFERRDENGETHIVAFEHPGAPANGLLVVVDLSEQDMATLARSWSRRDLGVLLLSLLTAAVLAGWGARRLVSRPLQRLTDAAEQWTAGNYQARAGMGDRNSEVGRLAGAFDRLAGAVQSNQQALQAANQSLEQRVAERTAELSTANRRLAAEMEERRAAELALRQVQKMEAIGRLTGGVAHDFNNLLTGIGGGVEFLIRAIPAPDQRVQRFSALLRDSLQRAGRLTHRLLAFARQQPLEVKILDLNRLIAGMSELLARTLGETIEVETVLAVGLWTTRTDVAQVESSLLNLAVNARDAMPDGGRLTIETANVVLDAAYAAANAEVKPGEYVMLAVSDSGTGMSLETAALAFDPFFTTKPVGQGTGLGLSMIYGFARQSGGHVKIYSEVGLGTTVKLYLPRALSAAEAPAPVAAVPDAAPEPRSETVLAVEDDDTVREMARSFLQDLGYPVIAVPDARAALEVLREREDIALLFTDVVLTGGVDGRKLAGQAVALRPGLRVLFTTGYTPNAIIHGGVLDPGVQLLPKPYTAEALGAKLRSVLDAAEG